MTSFLDAFIPPFKRHLAYAKFYKCLPFEWNEKQNKIIVNNTLINRVSTSVWTILSGLYAAFQIVNVILGNHDLNDKLFGALILAIYIPVFGTCMTFATDATPIENLNRLLFGQGNWQFYEIIALKNIYSKFVLDLQPRLSKSLLAVIKILCLLIETTYWVIPASSAGITVFLPCKPPFLGTFLLCRRKWTSLISKWVITSFLAVLEFVMAMQLSISAGHYSIFSQISGLVLFWGRCQQFMKSKNSKVDFLVKGYRQLQIQERLHNLSYKGRILPVSILAIPSIQIMTGFTLITLLHKVNILQTSIFLVMYLDVFLFGMIVLTFTSSIYVKTESWISKVKYRGGKDSRYFLKAHKSFRPLRLEFGNNFVDRITPLVVQEFCIRQTTSLLLLAET